MPTYDLISKSVLTSNTASILFSGISGTYTDLIAKCSLRSTENSVNATMSVRLNADSGNNYTFRLTQQQQTTLSNINSTSETALRSRDINGATSTADVFSHVEIYFGSYTSTIRKQTFFDTSLEQTDNTSYAQITSATANITSAITQIEFIVAGGANFVAGSSVYLYGIKNT